MPNPKWYKYVRILIFSLILGGCNSGAVTHEVVKDKNGEVTFLLKAVRDGSVHFYTYRYKGTNINFFIRMDGAGNLHTYFDACYTCYRYKKGYTVSENYIVCNECGKKYRLADEVWIDATGCAPINLKSEIRGDSLVVLRDNIIKGKGFF
ncbi:MAG: DUF2318 domain-containing protein [Nitrospirae bacterium]|nr:DUF2318 domain-containing protein [Nitrospirota bacterium]MBF0592466.1 DUF2318 domain-containing protein [Nitrospirota bacterium]